MKIRNLYCNYPDTFGPISFHDGLNVVLGEIRKQENKKKHTHNLGKTLLSKVIDFCLLRRKEKNFFLFEHQDFFNDFVFFVEIELHNGGFVTVRRPVDPGTKICFVRHGKGGKNFTILEESKWDHWDVPFEKAKEVLDGLLGLTTLSPWSYRNGIAYSLRSQGDFDTPFKVAKFAGKHRDWKPLLAHLLGFEWERIDKTYQIKEDLAEKGEEIKRLEVEAEGVESLDQLRGRIQIKENEVLNLENYLENFNFEVPDKEVDKKLVDKIDKQISQLNQTRYYLSSNEERIESSLSGKEDFNLKNVENIFNEAKIYFGEQIKKDYQSLIDFNKRITEERNSYLKEELEDIRDEISEINSQLEQLNSERAEALRILKSNESFERYRNLSQNLVEHKTSLSAMKEKEKKVEELVTERKTYSDLNIKLEEEQEAVRGAIKEGSQLHSRIRGYFNDIVSRVLGKTANLYLDMNDEGNVEFKIELADSQGNTTDAGEGHTYSRLLCVAFDMALQKEYSNKPFFHFVYHDGPLEGLDDRVKLNLLDLIREYSDATYQHIITAIDSELPVSENGEKVGLEKDEVVLLLHDEDENGRLFRMDAW